MKIAPIDWLIVGLVFLITIGIGLYSSRKSGKSFKEYFLAGGSMPWWLLGISMVATTFSADTPNLVADIVRNNGISGNWVWWAFLLTGMLTTFVYAKLWKRSGILTDLEFYELRYSGKPATFLRGFRALYLGIFFNCVVMATVLLAGMKIGSVMLGLSSITTLLVICSVSVLYTLLGGLRGVLLSDFFLFIIAMIGAVGAAIVISNLPEVGGFDKLISHENVVGKLNFTPDFSDKSLFIPLLLIPLAVQWWSSWYPGAEPGGGGYIAQRMFSAKNEKHATAATLLFNIAHYALRPWPWIIVALGSLIVFPDLASLKTAFPNVSEAYIKDDLAYPAMLTFLPKGLMGIVIASLIAALLSTISTHLNWGASYVTHDFYSRFINKDATDNQLVNFGRIATFVLMVLAALIALGLQNALEAFNLILQIGAGTGLIYILRWFWKRINAYSEIAGMVTSGLMAFWFKKIGPALGFSVPETDWEQMLWGVGITTLVWLAVTFMTRPTDKNVLNSFWQKIHGNKNNTIPVGLLAMLVGSILVYSTLFGVGWLLFGQTIKGIIGIAIAAICGLILKMLWGKLEMDA